MTDRRPAERGVGTGVVLAVDDDRVSLALLESVLSADGHEVWTTTDPAKALAKVASLRPDVVLTDVTMPGLTGFDVCRLIRVRPETARTPVVLITSLDDDESRCRALEAGATGYVTKPVDEVDLLLRVRTLVGWNQARRAQLTTESVVRTLAGVVQVWDPATSHHSARVVHNAERLGRALDLPDSEIDTLRRAGVLHDIGKIGVPVAVVRKPGPLTPEERQTVQAHVTIGESMLAPLEPLRRVLPVIRHHHERWDGRGYPDGLSGEQIPLLARIVQIADIFDAVTSRRPYRPPEPVDRAVDIIRSEAGRACDPKLLGVFVDRVVAHCAVEGEADQTDALYVDLTAVEREARR